MLHIASPLHIEEEKSGQLTFLPKPMHKADLCLSRFKPPVKADRPLPEAFEDACKDCERSMKRVPYTMWGDTQPHATFHCSHCNLFLYIFPAQPKDLVVWSDKLRNAINITNRIGELLALREHKEHLRRIRDAK